MPPLDPKHEPGCPIKGLGAHRLRGLTSDVQLFQVAAKGLRASFPPLRT